MLNTFNLPILTSEINTNLIIALAVLDGLMLLLVIIMVIRFHITKSIGSSLLNYFYHRQNK